MDQSFYLDGVHPRLIAAFDVLEERFDAARDSHDDDLFKRSARELLVGGVALVELCKTNRSKFAVESRIGIDALEKRTRTNLIAVACAAIAPAGSYPPDAVLLGLEEQSLRATLTT